MKVGWRKYKYPITLAVFLLYLTFFDNCSFLRRIKVVRECVQLNKEIERYQAEYQADSIRLHELTYNREALEKYAREHYKMKKPEEVVYIIEE
ncbi:MAG: septum formation initiator family protein [Bacteroidales bacterium]|nr:septum formation initiator family protein [Bacteroidales bacterium]